MYYLYDVVYVMGVKSCGLSSITWCVNNVKCTANILSAKLKAKARLVNAYESQLVARIVVWLLCFSWCAIMKKHA